MLKILSEINHQQADVISVASVWKAQAWYPVLLSLLFDYPHLIQHPLLAPLSQPPPFQPQEVQLAVWPTSGDTAKQKDCLKRLEHCSWPHGETNQTGLTTHSFTSGSAGVLHRTEIPFQVL